MTAATVIAIFHTKGGVGKTTTAHFLASHLADAGANVLAIDLDPQASLTRMAQPESNGQHRPQHIGHVLGGAVAPSANLRSASQMSSAGYAIVPSSLELANVAEGLRMRNLGRIEALDRAIRKEGHRWDYILIDCPPDTGVLSLNALWAADACIVPCEPEPLPIEALAQVAQVIAEVEEARGRTIRRESVATKVDTRTTQHQHGLNALERAGAVVVIPARRGQGAWELLYHAYRPLAERILAATQPEDVVYA